MAETRADKLADANAVLLAALNRIYDIYNDNSEKMAPMLGGDPLYTMERAVGLAHEAIAKAEGK